MFKKKDTKQANIADTHKDNDVIVDTEPVVDVEPIVGADRSVEDGTLDDSVVAEENALETIKKLREKLKIVDKEKQEYLTGWQLAKADFINARKRDEADRAAFVKFANEQLFFDLIPVLEHWDMALSHRESWEKADKNWRVGVESIFAQLKKALADNGLVEMNPVGEKFDHAKHEAISYEPVPDEGKDHVILEVVQKGYILNEKILKAAKVKVGEWKKV